jgi:hypothetical protein
LSRHRCTKPEPDDEDNPYARFVPADPNARADLAAKADRWWRDLPLYERLRLISDYADTNPLATGPISPV